MAAAAAAADDAAALRWVYGLSAQPPLHAQQPQPLDAADRLRTLYAAARDKGLKSDYLDKMFGPWFATLEGQDWVPPSAGEYQPISWGEGRREREWQPCPSREPSFEKGVGAPLPLNRPRPDEALEVIEWGKDEQPHDPRRVVTTTTYRSTIARHEAMMQDVQRMRAVQHVSAIDVAMKLIHPVPLEHDLRVVRRSFQCAGVVIEQQNVPLTCPITLRRMSLPARGAQCTHLAVFDLKNWACMLLERVVPKTYWKCPHCNEVIFLGGCYISPYFAAVLQATENVGNPDKAAVAVEVRADGSFAAAEKEAEKRLPTSQPRGGSADAGGSRNDEILIE